jgi:hypothetical protein
VDKLSPADAIGMTLGQASLLCENEACDRAFAGGQDHFLARSWKYARENRRALGFLCERYLPTLLQSQRFAQPGMDYAETVLWAARLEPPSDVFTRRISQQVVDAVKAARPMMEAAE